MSLNLRFCNRKIISPCFGSLKLCQTAMNQPKVLLLQTAASPDSWADRGKLGKSSTKDGDNFMGSYSTESKPKQSCFPNDTWIF